VRRSTPLAIVLATLALACSASGSRPAVLLPRDHFGHASSSIEWWYFTALVHDRAGTPYSVFFTLFSSGGILVPVSQVLDLKTGQRLGHSEQAAPGAVAGTALDAKAGQARLRFLPAAHSWRFSVTTAPYALSLTARPLKPYVLHGGGSGLIQQAAAGPSHYYSATRMRAAGTLRAGGRTFAVSGESWFDHQWGNFRDDPRAFDWNWFSCRFDDGSELMLYEFRDRRTGRPLPRYATGTFVARNGRTRTVRSFSATPGQRALTAAGRRWTLDWRLRVPVLSLSEKLSASVADQLVRNTLVPTFWEGAAAASGSRTGTCFVELSYR
jgi:predicted secreted hydrolase